MNAKLVNVDLRQDMYVVCPYSKTEDGFWVLSDRPVLLAATADAGALGDAIRDALSRSREGVPTPPRDDDTAKPLLDLFGLRSYNAYAKGTRSVEVYAEASEDGESIEVTPKRNGGPRNGFTPIKDAIVRAAYDSPGQLGDAVIAAFTHAV